jgi:hypothetical protein
MDAVAYNKFTKNTQVTLVGNWVEEKALQAATGDGRNGALVGNTQGRLITHTTTRKDAYNPWNTITTESYINHLEGSTRVPERPRNRVLGNKYLQMAAQMVADQKKQEEDEYQQELLVATYGDRVNTQAVRDEAARTEYKGEPTSASLNGPMISTYSTLSLGMSRYNANANPFSKNTSFSKPIDEFMDGEGETR